MPLELQNRVVELVCEILRADTAATPIWLMRPGQVECGDLWPLVSSIYRDLTGLTLPPVMRPIERRSVDAVLITAASPRILEVDEIQHFNPYRAATLVHYVDKIPVAFDTSVWIARSNAKGRLEGGGFATPKPPLFPGDGGRHRQRAFRDALCDVLAVSHGFAPTLRIADFEVRDWLHRTDARYRMEQLIAGKFSEPLRPTHP